MSSKLVQPISPPHSPSSPIFQTPTALKARRLLPILPIPFSQPPTPLVHHHDFTYNPVLPSSPLSNRSSNLDPLLLKGPLSQVPPFRTTNPKPRPKKLVEFSASSPSIFSLHQRKRGAPISPPKSSLPMASSCSTLFLSSPSTSLPPSSSRPPNTSNLLNDVMFSSPLAPSSPSFNASLEQARRKEGTFHRENPPLFLKLARPGSQSKAETQNGLVNGLLSRIPTSHKSKPQTPEFIKSFNTSKNPPTSNLATALQSTLDHVQEMINGVPFTFSSSPVSHRSSAPLTSSPHTMPPRKRVKIAAGPDGAAKLIAAPLSHLLQPRSSCSTKRKACRPSQARDGACRLVTAEVAEFGRIVINHQTLVQRLGIQAATAAISRAGRRDFKNQHFTNTTPEEPERIGTGLDYFDVRERSAPSESVSFSINEQRDSGNRHSSSRSCSATSTTSNSGDHLAALQSLSGVDTTLLDQHYHGTLFRGPDASEPGTFFGADRPRLHLQSPYGENILSRSPHESKIGHFFKPGSTSSSSSTLLPALAPSPIISSSSDIPSPSSQSEAPLKPASDENSTAFYDSLTRTPKNSNARPPVYHYKHAASHDYSPRSPTRVCKTYNASLALWDDEEPLGFVSHETGNAQFGGDLVGSGSWLVELDLNRGSFDRGSSPSPFL